MEGKVEAIATQHMYVLGRLCILVQPLRRNDKEGDRE
jgi:hypothetical protein